MRLLLCLLFLALASPVLAECGDDPRLAQLPELLARDRQPETRIQITPESFIALQPDVRKFLGDNLLICPGNPVYNDSPSYPPRLTLDFMDIWPVLEEAIVMDDWENVLYIRDHVEVEPLTPEAIFSLLVVPVLDSESLRELELAFFMIISNLEYGSESNASGPIFLADVYAALGGKALSQPVVIWSPNYDQLAKAQSRAAALKEQNVIFLPYADYEPRRAAAAMAKFGIEMVSAREYLSQ